MRPVGHFVLGVRQRILGKQVSQVPAPFRSGLGECQRAEQQTPCTRVHEDTGEECLPASPEVPVLAQVACEQSDCALKGEDSHEQE